MGTLTNSSGGFTEEDLNYLRVFKVVTSEGCAIMQKIFQWGSQNKNVNKTLEEYLLQDKKMDKKLFRKLFNKTMLKKIRTNPSCDLFDISLLMLVIKVACDGVAPKDSDIWHTEDRQQLEYNLTLLKNERNEVAHNVTPLSRAEMKNKIEELRNLFAHVINLACERFSICCATKTQTLDQLNVLIDKTRDQPLSETEIVEYNKMLQVEHMIYIIKTKGPEELRQKYKCLSLINPFSFIDGCDIRVEVESIFSKIEIIESGRYSKGESIEIENLLQVNDVRDDHFCLSNPDTGNMIVIDGCSGAGKTTLTKYLMFEWSKCSTKIEQLLDYDLVLLMECRNSSIESLPELLANLMPNTCAMTQDNMTKFARTLKLLFLVDGLDELNQVSKKVFLEIVEICRTGDHTMFCTSRPEKLKDLFKIVPEELQVGHLHITGIPVEQRSSFAKTYHNRLVELKKSDQSTEELMEFLENSHAGLKAFYRFPLNLVLLTYLWAEKSGNVKDIMTTTELYQKIHEMLVQKLLQRLKHQDSTKDISVSELEAKVQTLLHELFRQALLTLKDDEILINSKSIQKLMNLCSDLGLPSREVLSAFLVLKVVWTRSGSEEQLSFPHKDMHDFFAANCLYLAITDPEYCNTLKTCYLEPSPSKSIWNTLFGFKRPRIIHELLEALLQTRLNSTKLAKFQNVFKHLAGLLHSKSDGVNDEECKELVDVLSESGISDKEQWLDVLGEVKCDQRTARYIAKNVFKRKLWVKDARITEFLSIMPYAMPKYVILDFSSDPEDLPDLMKLLNEVAKHECYVNVYFHHHFRNPEEGKTSNNFLKCLLDDDARCRVQAVIGCLSGEPLPKLGQLSHLSVSILNDDHARAMGKTFHCSIRVKCVHVLPGVSPAAIIPIAAGDFVDVFLDEVFLFYSHTTDEQVEWVSNVAQAVVGTQGFQGIRFPVSELSRDGCEDLLNKMAERGVKVGGSHFFGGGVWVSSDQLSQEDVKELAQLSQAKLGRPLYLKKRKQNWDSGDIWTDDVGNTTSLHS